MSIWPIFVVGALVAFLTWRRGGVQRLVDSPRGTREESSNQDELVRSLDALIDFLSRQEQFKWVGILRGIRTDLQSQPTETEALSRLSDTFGGMGSLNDLVFDGPGANQESGRLMDGVFRDMKLYHGTPGQRAEWLELEEEHKDEPPPRIKHALRKE